MWKISTVFTPLFSLSRPLFRLCIVDRRFFAAFALAFLQCWKSAKNQLGRFFGYLRSLFSVVKKSVRSLFWISKVTFSISAQNPFGRFFGHWWLSRSLFWLLIGLFSFKNDRRDDQFLVIDGYDGRFLGIRQGCRQ